MKNNPFIFFITNTLYSLGMLLTALLITWWLLSAVDFFYPTFYQWLDIGQTINEFGPQNRFKEGFATTSMPQHFEYFSQIVTAINNGGEGLATISYPYNGQHVPLLRDAEVRHLQDVANLLDNLFVAGGVIMTALMISVVYKIRKVSPFVTIKMQLVQLITFVLSLIAICWLIGFKTVFYWLHEVAFPAENDWFFYYQDSLMTTMMQAPMLFAPISATMVIVCCVIFVGLNVFIKAVNRRVNDSVLPVG
ncbi:DUF1461 domain-containing protein [Psychrobium sp. MM17-31]|uniref:lipoprotein intramolecular transacylase Lit n=1 Tax=Psychrobium sp. MM17-31 TaxID=2917758 RepID=UPI001EF508AF|nr:DUF1461 domain-containing protein [Psychrobium sp. MM17-31]MCG7529812.1 DUF1461 domain-containing protein [Psychrobium sp. MM17-31]